MKLNTGQFLRQEYESVYGMQRRLLWANRLEWGGATSLRAITAKLNITQEDGGTITTWPEFLCSLHRHEPAFSAPNPVSLEGYDPGRSIRNCPICARLFYHAELYQLPWLEYCPTHTCRIVKLCPDCGAPWPKVGESRRRSCQTCGTWTPLESLIKQRGINEDLGVALRPLAICLVTPLPGVRCELTRNPTESSRFRAWADDHSIGMFDRYYPSLIARINPRCRAVFSKLRIATPPLMSYSFNRDDYIAAQEIDEASLFRQVAEGIRSRVLNRYGVDVTKDTTLWSDSICQESVIRSAWTAWHFVYKRARGEEITAKEAISFQPFQTAYQEPPMLALPRLVPWLGRQVTTSSYEPNYDTTWTNLALPAAAYEIIYKAKIGCLFRRLVAFYDCLSCLWLRVGLWHSFLKKRVTVEEFERSLPDIANPSLPTHIHLCICVNDDRVQLTLPAEHGLVPLDDLKLKTPVTPCLAPNEF